MKINKPKLIELFVEWLIENQKTFRPLYGDWDLSININDDWIELYWESSIKLETNPDFNWTSRVRIIPLNIELCNKVFKNHETTFILHDRIQEFTDED